ncbi:MAG: hypothetical protein QNK60_03645 [Flavobacteriales bacterium]
MKKLLIILLCLPLIGLGQCVSGDCENGYGTYTWSSGDIYKGEWKAGFKEGKGTYTWDNGSKYVGEYKNGNFHGQGTYTWTSGNKYVGE